MTGRRALRLALNAVAGAAAALALLLLVGMVLVPMVTGWVPLTILSGSMTPTYKIGSQVYVERMDSPEKVRTLRRGDVISFMPRANDLTMVTHRIIAVEVAPDGSRTFTTKGDANTAADATPVREKMVRGKVRYNLPYVGYLALLLNGGQKKSGVLAVAGLLFAYAVWQVARGLGARRAERPEVRSGWPARGDAARTLDDAAPGRELAGAREAVTEHETVTKGEGVGAP